MPLIVDEDDDDQVGYRRPWGGGNLASILQIDDKDIDTLLIFRGQSLNLPAKLIRKSHDKRIKLIFRIQDCNNSN